MSNCRPCVFPKNSWTVLLEVFPCTSLACYFSHYVFDSRLLVSPAPTSCHRLENRPEKRPKLSNEEQSSSQDRSRHWFTTTKGCRFRTRLSMVPSNYVMRRSMKWYHSS